MTKNKKIIILLTIILIITIILITLNILINKDINNYINNNINLIKDKLTIEYGDTYTSEELTKKLNIDKKLNVKFIINNKTINKEYSFNTVGNFKLNVEVNLKYKTKYLISKNITFNKIVDISVVDTNKPIIEGITKKTITVGDSIDNIKNNIKAYDKVDGELEFIIDGNIDTTKEGTYQVNIISKDKNNNETSEILEIEVISKKENSVIVGKTSNGYDIIKKNNIYYIDGIIIVNKTYSLPQNYNPGKLLSEFSSAYNKMKKAAANDNIKLNIVSGYRSYTTQKNIYNNYVNRDGKATADTYSARPGHSEHQLGLAADLNTANSKVHFENSKEYAWLKDNCYKYGFILRYVEGKQEITGYKFEPWHYRYVGEELATKLYNNGDWLTIEEYFGITSKYE